MPERQPPQIIDPATAFGSGEMGPYPFDLYERQFDRLSAVRAMHGLIAQHG